MQGIADVRDDSSSRTGQRLVVVLKRDAIARVVLNNLYKHTDLQQNFSCNMLALVDDVPRTLTIDQFITNWIATRSTSSSDAPATGCARPRSRRTSTAAWSRRSTRSTTVIALIRRSQTTDEARDELMAFLDIDDVQARAILDMQLRRLAAMERQAIIDRLAELERMIADLEDILANEDAAAPDRQRGAAARSSTSTATSDAARSSPPTATCRWRT